MDFSEPLKLFYVLYIIHVRCIMYHKHTCIMIYSVVYIFKQGLLTMQKQFPIPDVLKEESLNFGEHRSSSWSLEHTFSGPMSLLN